jgi:hypothetical protein
MTVIFTVSIFAGKNSDAFTEAASGVLLETLAVRELVVGPVRVTASTIGKPSFTVFGAGGLMMKFV